MADFFGTNGADNVHGTVGNDRLYGWDSLNGAGDFGPMGDHDYLYGGSGADLIEGGAGNDFLNDTAGANTLNGGTGDDTIEAAFLAGNSVDGGAGIDHLWVNVQANGALIFALGDPSVETVVRGLRIRGIEVMSVYASEFDDSITGGAYGDSMLGSAGDDHLVGGGGDDWLSGGGDRDTMLGGAGNDTFVLFDALGADSIDGGDGIDLLEFNTNAIRRNFTLVVDDAFTMPEGTVVTGVERIDYQGTPGADLITGGAYADIITGGGGADQLLGGGGNDSLSGNGVSRSGPVASVLLGGAGNDFVSYHTFSGGERIEGGAGFDVLQFSLRELGKGVEFAAVVLRASHTLTNGTVLGGFERIDVTGTAGDDKIKGGAFGDTINGMAGHDSLFGGTGADELYGGGGNERLYGGGGNDRLFAIDGANILFGGTGDDDLEVWGNLAQRMYGGEGNDSLTGGGGADVIDGGAGADNLTGGGGADHFDFRALPPLSGADSIEDFVVGLDDLRLDLRVFGGLSRGDLAPGAFVLGVAAADGSDRIIYDQATGRIWHDPDGVGAAAEVWFASVTAGTALTAADFTVI